jgi:benzodiazapine receptor
MGWNSLGLSAIDWTLVKLAIAGAIGAIVILRRGDIAYGLVVAWAAMGIVVKQAATPIVSGAADTVVILALLLVSYEAFCKLRGR